MKERASAALASGSERWARSVLVIFSVLLGGAVAEGWLAAARAPFDNRLALGIAAVLVAQLIAFGLSLLLAAVVEFAKASLRVRQDVSRDDRPPSGVELAAAALVVLPLVPLGVAKALIALQLHFKNQGLIAWGTGLVALVLCLLAGAAIRLLAGKLGDARERIPSRFRSPLLFAPGLLLVAVTGFLAFDEAGLAQLDPWLLLSPASIAACLPLARKVRRVFPGRALSVVALAGATSFFAAFLSHALVDNALSVLSRHGTWSRPALSALRGLTDFDRDGYSGWFSGGDCAPFDRTVHPGAREAPKDGIDNNCMAGDGGQSSPIKPPEPATAALRGVPDRPNLLLITIETLRADRVSLLGYHRPTTPRLEELGKESVVFEKTYATAPSTRLSLAALLSGQLPSAIDWLAQPYVKQMRRIAPETPWLPSRLRESGYATLAVHTNFRAFTSVESAGFDRGFQHFDLSTRLSFVGGTMQGFPGGAQVDRALTLLQTVGEGPWFLWTHLMEPHYLYEQPPLAPSFGTDEAALYDAEVAEADRQVGRLVHALRQSGALDKTVILVLGDHGEEFGEHGARFHGSNLYEAQVRTAALLRVPGLPPRRVSDAISFLDLMPTLLDLMGLRSGFEKLMGRNLVPLLAGHDLAPGFFLENFRVDNGAGLQLAFLDWPFKLIYTEDGASLELYDVLRDPLEQRNLHSLGNRAAQRLAEPLYRYLESSLRSGVRPLRTP